MLKKNMATNNSTFDSDHTHTHTHTQYFITFFIITQINLAVRQAGGDKGKGVELKTLYLIVIDHQLQMSYV